MFLSTEEKITLWKPHILSNICTNRIYCKNDIHFHISSWSHVNTYVHSLQHEQTNRQKASLGFHGENCDNCAVQHCNKDESLWILPYEALQETCMFIVANVTVDRVFTYLFLRWIIDKLQHHLVGQYRKQCKRLLSSPPLSSDDEWTRHMRKQVYREARERSLTVASKYCDCVQVLVESYVALLRECRCNAWFTCMWLAVCYTPGPFRLSENCVRVCSRVRACVRVFARACVRACVGPCVCFIEIETYNTKDTFSKNMQSERAKLLLLWKWCVIPSGNIKSI